MVNNALMIYSSIALIFFCLLATAPRLSLLQFFCLSHTFQVRYFPHVQTYTTVSRMAKKIVNTYSLLLRANTGKTNIQQIHWLILNYSKHSLRTMIMNIVGSEKLIN